MTHSLAQRSLVETLATGFLAYSASRAGNADINALDQCLLIGLVLASLIHLCGRASGAHLNPLVSFMLNRQLFDWRRRIFWKETIAYSIAQIIGAVIGFRLDPAGNTTTTFHTISFVPELIFSFALFSLILMWSREGRLCPFSRPLSGVVMGMAIAAMVMMGGLTNCGLYNPAVSLALISEGASGVPGLILAQCLAMAAALLICARNENPTSISAEESKTMEIK